MYEVILYETERGNCPIDEYKAKLAKQNKMIEIAQINLFQKRLEEHGLAMEREFPKSVKKLDGDLYELRPGANRVFFLFFTGDTFVLLHAYRKQSQKTPKHEMEKAKQEIKDYLRRSK